MEGNGGANTSWHLICESKDSAMEGVFENPAGLHCKVGPWPQEYLEWP